MTVKEMGAGDRCTPALLILGISFFGRSSSKKGRPLRAAPAGFYSAFALRVSRDHTRMKPSLSPGSTSAQLSACVSAGSSSLTER